MKFGKIKSHTMGLWLLRLRNEYAYGFTMGKLTILWDTGKPVPEED